MKTMKKFATVMLTICLMLVCFSMSVSAAPDGKIMFTDPETKVGETVEVTGVVQKSSGNFGKIEITMKYDTDLLKFNSGDGITESSAGQITYVGDATNETRERKEFKFSLTALKAGSAKIEITNSTIKNVSGTVLDYTAGSSTIKIAEGDGTTTTEPTTEPTTGPTTTTDLSVNVNGVSYLIASEFPEDAIPKGYEAATLEYDLNECNVVYSEEFGLYLAYLVNEENAGDFFMYIEADATFAPYKEITVSESTTIALLSDVADVVLPEEYRTTTVVLDEYEFPAWQNQQDTNYCILYAINNHGEKALYQLDNAEGTYQKFIAPEIEEEKDSSFIGNLSSLLKDHLDYVILGTGLGFLIFILIIIVLSVKLYNRNAELDEIYDEYGIDAEEDTKDDVMLEIEDEDEYDDEENEENDENGDITEEELDEATLFVQEGMKELTQEIVDEVAPMNEKELTKEIVLEIPAESAKKSEGGEEASLGKALEEVAAQKEEKEALYDDADDIFENFSMDFIDLDE